MYHVDDRPESGGPKHAYPWHSFWVFDFHVATRSDAKVTPVSGVGCIRSPMYKKRKETILAISMSPNLIIVSTNVFRVV